MYIKEINIENYRNLNGLHILFDKELNFIVGDNNIGKSNLLKLLNNVINVRNFASDDFNDITKEIKIEMSLYLETQEIGIFDDLFDVTTSNTINLIIKQKDEEENIEYLHKETEIFIPKSKIKSLNYLYYDSMRNPISEINFDKNRGAGKFLNYLVKTFMEKEENKEKKYFIQDDSDEIISYINKKLELLEVIKDNKIVSQVNVNNISETISRIISLSNEKNHDISKSGYGIQFSFVLILEILQNLINSKNNKKIEMILKNNETNEINVIMGIDEPEIHLHPYMQRNLIKYLLKVIKNNDDDFSTLIKELVDIDKVKGQLIIVTHSPNILIEGYKKIVLMKKVDNETISVKNGAEIQLEESLEKHFETHIMQFKEAFFAKKVLFVEGVTEIGAMYEFAKKLNIDLDYLGVSVISADGGDGIPKLIKVMDEFDIEAYAIMDNDIYSANQLYQYNTKIYSTELKDFEEDVYESLSGIDFINYIVESDPNCINGLWGIARRLNLVISVDGVPPNLDTLLSSNSPEQLLRLKNEKKDEALEILRKNKSIITGSILAKNTSIIPNVYKNILNMLSGEERE